MVGIIVAGVVALCLWLADNSREEIFRKSSTVLFWWYIWTTALVVVLVFAFSLLAGGLSGAGISGSAAGLVIGGMAGGVFGLVLALIVVFFSLFSIVGAHLLRTAIIKDSEGNYQWGRKRAVVGSVLVAIPVVLDIIMRLFGAQA